MEFQFSGVAIIILIAIGILVTVLLFIFAKRQIVRFALKTRHGPHCPIGSDAPKHLKQEIDRRLEVVKDIKYEPLLINTSESQKMSHHEFKHIYRMKAVDALSSLEKALIDAAGSDIIKRPPGQDIRVYLLKLAKEGPLQGCETKLIHQFVDLYKHARHEPTPVFGPEEYDQYMNLLNLVRNHINKKSPSRSCTSTPSIRPKDTAAQFALNGKTEISIVSENKSEQTNIETTESSV